MDIEFVDGLIVKAPHERAPDFVKAAISIKVADLAAWLARKSDQEWVNVDVKESKTGKWYAAVSTFEKGAKSAPKEERPAPKRAQPGDKFNDMSDDIPF